MSRCSHCGREGTLEYRDSVTLDTRESRVEHHSGAGISVEEATLSDVVLVQRCSACREPTVLRYEWLDGYDDDPENVDMSPLYPSAPRALSELPPGVKRRWLQALERKHDPDGFAVKIGAMLEAVCKDQDCWRGPGSLDNSLKKLVADGKLPDSLGEQALLIKDYRNIGGHDDDLAVLPTDITLIQNFAEALLQFLFWGPAQLVRGTDALKNRRDSLADV